MDRGYKKLQDALSALVRMTLVPPVIFTEAFTIRG